MDRNLALEVIRVTEAAALFAGRFMGRGDDDLAYKSAIDAIKRVISSVPIDGNIICERIVPGDNPLRIGTTIGNKNGPKVDVVIDPLDGTTTCARGGQNSISAVAIGEKGAFLKAPPIYMEKIAVGPEVKGAIDITEPPDINIKRVARRMDKYIEDVTVCILDRERHRSLNRISAETYRNIQCQDCCRDRNLLLSGRPFGS